jgi:hypothetical protein
MDDPVTRALAILNEALERDPGAITRLVNMRVECNDALATHPAIRVGIYEGIPKVGVLGLLNAALDDSPLGVIGAKGQVDPKTGLFRRIREFVDLRDDGVNVLA